MKEPLINSKASSLENIISFSGILAVILVSLITVIALRSIS